MTEIHGRTLKIVADSLATFLDLQRVQKPIRFPVFPNTLETMKEDLALRFTGQRLLVWNTLSSIQLPEPARLVNLLFLHCLLPTYHNNTLSSEMAYLVDAVMHGQPLDIPTIIIHKMIIKAERRTATIILSFGLLIM